MTSRAPRKPDPLDRARVADVWSRARDVLRAARMPPDDIALLEARLSLTTGRLRPSDEAVLRAAASSRTPEEAADRLCCAVSTFYDRLARARARLPADGDHGD